MTDIADPLAELTPEALRAHVATELTRSRARSTALTDAVDEADLIRQHSPLMSPLVWDLAHIGSQEELWLVRDVGGREPLRPEIDGLYDAFQHTRASRVQLPLLTPGETRRYVAEVREKALEALEHSPAARPPPGGARVRLRHDRAARAAARRDHAGTHQLRAGSPVLHAERPPPCRSEGRGAGAGRGARPGWRVQHGHLDRAGGRWTTNAGAPGRATRVRDRRPPR